MSTPLSTPTNEIVRDLQLAIEHLPDAAEVCVAAAHLRAAGVQIPQERRWQDQGNGRGRWRYSPVPDARPVNITVAALRAKVGRPPAQQAEASDPAPIAGPESTAE